MPSTKPWVLPLLTGWGLVWIGIAAAGEPVLRRITNPPGPNLLRNGDFEQVQAGRLAQWSGSPNGYDVATGEGRNGSTALVCRVPGETGWYGASQTLNLQRSSAIPLVVRGWSRAAQVTGGTDSGYSVYVDLVYTDGTPLWGQTGNFRTGTHDWERVEFTVLPEKPVRSLSLYVLVRGHAGTVWFDDLAVTELNAGANAFLFQGTTMTLPSPLPTVPTADTTAATADGLRLGLKGTRVTSLEVGGRTLAGPVAGGFLVRDVAADSDLLPFEDGVCPQLELRIQANVVAHTNHLVVEGEVRDTRGQDRAILLLFALPLDATGWLWHDDIGSRRTITGKEEYAVLAGVQAGTLGALSTYPLAAVNDERTGVALGLDMDRPALFRAVYHAGARLLFLAYDFGLSRETDQFPGGARFRLVVYPYAPQWGFRAAFQRYTQIFPERFHVRSRDQGIWMPFTDVSRVQGWQDFGFRYHEGNNNVGFDDANGILSFRYTEPMTWWMPMAPALERTEAEAIRVRDGYAAGPAGYHQKMAAVTQTAGMWDAEGRPVLLFRNEPWNNGAVWSLNPNPRLPSSPNAATVPWNTQVKQELYGSGSPTRLDGEYLDSLEGYVTPDLNFRREHFRSTTVPLSFALGTRVPALFKGLSIYEFTRWISEDVHALGRLTFANSVPYRFPYLCGWLDIMGTEVNWLTGEGYAPASHRQMALWRTLSGQKPYLLLMNTDYDRFGPYVERYFQRCLLYGIFPSMFSHNASENPYWENPKWYERDRALFRKYIPVLRRLAQAGWQPVTEATVSPATLRVERFGPGTDGVTYHAVYNDTTQTVTGVWREQRMATDGGVGRLPPQDLLNGTELMASGDGWRVEVPAHGALALAVRPLPRVARIELTPRQTLQFEVTDAPQTHAVLECSDNLTVWETVATNVGNPPAFVWEERWPAEPGNRFFRFRW